MATASLSARRKSQDRRASRVRRHRRVRKRVMGIPGRPRLVVFRSAKHIYAQVIDDTTGRTLAAASTQDGTLRGQGGTKTEAAKRVGSLAAERAKAAGVDKVTFDRGGFAYHGRVEALAEGAREGGLQF